MASSDVFHHGQRLPTASVNFIAVHDGFTLADLTSYATKHNHANGEDNRDGRDGELCANFGAEGRRTTAINATRERVRRACWPRCCWPRARPCCARRRDRQQPGRQQQRLLPGQPHHLAGLDRAAARWPRPSLVAERWRCARRAAAAPPALVRGRQGDASIAWYAPAATRCAHDWHDAGQRAFGAQLRAAGAASRG
jgi:glycogen operon protein